MFFYDWSNINRYSRTTMQHVTAVKIGGGGAGTRGFIIWPGLVVTYILVI